MQNINVLNKVLETIKKYRMINSGDRIIVGVSGGPDSLCLINILNELKNQLNFELYMAHVNHCLRGKSADDDELFVSEFAQKSNIPVFTKRIMVKQLASDMKLSIEEAGREARYTYFYELLKQVKGNKIAVGHNTNDSVETFLLNLIRGTGLEGLKGIEPVRGEIIRPLIKTSREEIEAYCRNNGLNPRTDETNSKMIFTRNRVRAGLIPYLKENFNANIVEAISRTAELLRDENELTSEMLRTSYIECLESEDDSSVVFALDKFNLQHDAVKRRIIRKAIEKIRGSKRSVEKVHVEQIKELALSARTGTKIELKKSFTAAIEYGRLVISKSYSTDNIHYSYEIPMNGRVYIEELNTYLNSRNSEINQVYLEKENKNICLLDREKIKGTIVVRNRRIGDWISLSGMSGTKKIKDFFIDEKIPRQQREMLPLIACGSEILWIIGKRYNNKYKITDQTKEVLILEY